MAFDDILAAISQHADEQITAARSVHQKKLSEMKEASERAIAKNKQDIAIQKEERKASMKNKASMHASITKRNTLLEKKQSLLNSLYDAVIEHLVKLDDASTKKVLKELLSKIHQKGTILPAKAHASALKSILPSGCTLGDPIDTKGGFIFVSEKQEFDCTFENLVRSQLRPQTEVEISQSLFAAA